MPDVQGALAGVTGAEGRPTAAEANHLRHVSEGATLQRGCEVCVDAAWRAKIAMGDDRRRRSDRQRRERQRKRGVAAFGTIWSIFGIISLLPPIFWMITGYEILTGRLTGEIESAP